MKGGDKMYFIEYEKKAGEKAAINLDQIIGLFILYEKQENRYALRAKVLGSYITIKYGLYIDC
jgi:hypothetical protein